MMKSLIVLSLVGVMSVACADQTKQTNAVQAKDASAVAVVPAGESVWSTDFAASSAKAKAENKYMLLDFSGSDWCGWCIKLDKEVFSKPEFQEFAAKNLVLVMLDFPRAKPQTAEIKAQNEKLSKQYGIKGFPSVLILNPDGKLVEQTGYRAGGAAAYVAYLGGILDNDRKKGAAPAGK